MSRITVDLGERSYPIHIYSELDLQSLRQATNGRRCFVISDKNVEQISLAKNLKAEFPDWGWGVIPAGETSKSLSMYNDLFTQLIHWGADRHSVVIALGGGVVGDLAGFVASTYMRGIEFIQIPTSLLAMVDSSVGGKVAVNHPEGKNLIGSFYQPSGVWVSIDSLKTLDSKQFSSGLAEVIKYGLIWDADFFSWLEKNTNDILNLNPEKLIYLIEFSLKVKAEVVSKDEFESGLRAILNLGHTFAHAEELLSGYGKILHGEAVAAGMLAACQVALSMNRFSATDLKRLEALLLKCQLPTKLTTLDDFKLFWKTMLGDKKSKGGEVNFIIPKGLGQVGLPERLDQDLVQKALA